MAVRVMKGVSRFWRLYILLLIASIMVTYLIYLGRSDPYLHSIPYFRFENKFKSIFLDADAEKIKKLMDNNVLDYEFSISNSKFCFDKQYNLAAEDYLLLNEVTDSSPNKSSDKPNFDLLLLAISSAKNFQHRTAIRQTWHKHLNKINAKLVFFIGDPFFMDVANKHVPVSQRSSSARNKRAAINNRKEDTLSSISNKFTESDRTKLDREIKDYNDIVQINMPDNDNFTSAKTLISFRWLQTYCHQVKYFFVLSDSAVLNHNLFEDMILNKNIIKIYLDDNSLVGSCDLSDENFAFALKLFYNDLYKSKKVSKRDSSSVKNLTGKEKSEDNVKNRIQQPIIRYKGEYCSNLGWMITAEGAKKLWQTALRTEYIIRFSPAYLNGYLAFKANLKHVSLFKYYDLEPKSNCLKVFQTNQNNLLCAENFTDNNRYINYIASWNSPAQSQLGLSKL